MTRRLLALTMALTPLLVLPSSAQAAPKPMTVAQVVALAKSVVGYSYWWGHGAWRLDGKEHGSCSGTCAGCGG